MVQWVTNLLATTVGTSAEKTVFQRNVTMPNALYAMPYAINQTKAILLVSKADVWMDVLLPGVVGGSATVVEVNADAAEPGFEPPVQKGISAEGKLSIGPYAVAVTTTLQLAS